MDAGKVGDAVDRQELCFFCGHGTIDDPGSIVPVLLELGSSSEGSTLERRITYVPRCKTCKSLHSEAVSRVGWRWAKRHLLFLLAGIACCALATWPFALLLPPSPFSKWTGTLLLAIYLIFWLFVLVRGWIIVLRRAQKSFDHDLVMRQLLHSVKLPNAYGTFPPLAERLSDGWKAYVSKRYLHGNWFFPYESVLACCGYPSCGKHCYDLDAWRSWEPGLLSLLAGASESFSGFLMFGGEEVKFDRSMCERGGLLSAKIFGSSEPGTIGPARSSPATLPPLRCCGCGRSFAIGQDAVAVSLEFALGQARAAVIISGGLPSDREDLVSSLDDVPADQRHAALERAKPSWRLIRDSLARGENRIWRCRACSMANRY